MRKTIRPILFLAGLFSYILAGAQKLSFTYSNSLKFVGANNDTLPQPFTGGFIAPQFGKVDLNLDGKTDLVVFDRAGQILHPFLNMGGTGQVDYRYAPQYRKFFPTFMNWVCFVDFDGDGKNDIIAQADPLMADSGSYIIPNNIRAYKNTSTATKLDFSLVSKRLDEGLPKPGGGGAWDTIANALYCNMSDIPSFSDIDNDGDIDMLIMSIIGGYIELWKNFQVEKSLPAGTLSLNQVDPCWGSIVVTDEIELGQSCKKYYAKANAHVGTTLATYDMDGDGDKDLLLGDVLMNHLFYLKNGKKELNWKYNNVSADTIIQVDTVFPKNTVNADFPSGLCAFFVEINNDGKTDLIVSTNNLIGSHTRGQIWYYQNNGTNAIPAFSFVQNDFLQDKTLDLGSRFAPTLIDYDQDGKQDLLVGTYGDWGVTENAKDRLILYRNMGTVQYPVYKVADSNYLNVMSMSISAIRPASGDVNGDGKTDIVLGSYDGTLIYYENTSSSTTGNLSFAAAVPGFKNIDVGEMSSPSLFDMNFDGKADLLVGNQDGMIHYFRNWSGQPVGYHFNAIPDADTLGQINTRPANYPYGNAAPFAFNIKNDSMLELLTGTFDGHVRSFRFSANLEGTFSELDSILLADSVLNAPQSATGNTARVIPLLANFDGDTIPDLLLGHNNGGVLFFKGVYRGDLPPVLGRDTVKPAPSSGIKTIETGIGRMRCYPNPGSGLVNIDRGTVPANLELELSVYSLTGQELIQQSMTKDQAGTLLDLTNLPGQVYWLRISCEGRSVGLFRIIKQ